MSEATPLPDPETPRRRIRILDDHLERDGAGVDGLPAGYRLWTPDDAALPERPVLDPAALYGLPGEVVRLLEPHTEADPAAMLGTFLALFACLAGPAACLSTGTSRHQSRLFVLVVGPTADGRKGTSLSDVRLVFDRVDPDFMRERCQAGFGSGESIVDAASDGKDPRLLIVEQEFSELLRKQSRTESTISTMIRSAFDGGRLEVHSRSKTSVAHDAHIGIVGHLTPGDLKSYMGRREIANGFGNRFLVLYSQRAKLLPRGGHPVEAELETLAQRVYTAAERARSVAEIPFTPHAEDQWSRLYRGWAAEVSDDPTGEMTARVDTQVARLALTYALTDESDAITPEHLEAADGLWRYSRDTVAFLFGDGRSGDPKIVKLLEAIRAAGCAGLASTEQHRAMGGHTSKAELGQLRGTLERKNLVHTYDVPTRGRRRTVSVAILPLKTSD